MARYEGSAHCLPWELRGPRRGLGRVQWLDRCPGAQTRPGLLGMLRHRPGVDPRPGRLAYGAQPTVDRLTDQRLRAQHQSRPPAKTSKEAQATGNGASPERPEAPPPTGVRRFNSLFQPGGSSAVETSGIASTQERIA